MTDYKVSYNIPDMRGIKSAAKISGLAEHHIRQLALTGKIKAVRAGVKILVNMQSLSDYLNCNTLNIVEEQGDSLRPIPAKLGGKQL